MGETSRSSEMRTIKISLVQPTHTFLPPTCSNSLLLPAVFPKSEVYSQVLGSLYPTICSGIGFRSNWTSVAMDGGLRTIRQRCGPTPTAASFAAQHAQPISAAFCVRIAAHIRARVTHVFGQPALLDATDELGMLVWDENHRNGEFDQVPLLVKRDRNHPSIIIWYAITLCSGDATVIIPCVQVHLQRSSVRHP
jgi:hypothetical protein